MPIRFSVSPFGALLYGTVLKRSYYLNLFDTFSTRDMDRLAGDEYIKFDICLSALELSGKVLHYTLMWNFACFAREIEAFSAIIQEQ